jgi:hypothetical protein
MSFENYTQEAAKSFTLDIIGWKLAWVQNIVADVLYVWIRELKMAMIITEYLYIEK